MIETIERSANAEEPTASAIQQRPVTVFVIEELAAIRELVAGFVGRLEGFRVVGTSGNRAEAESECARLNPDIAVIDWLLMSDVSGVNLAEAVRRCSPQTRVLVFSAASEAHFVNDAIAAGVAGFVVKSATLDTLAKALQAVSEG